MAITALITALNAGWCEEILAEQAHFHQSYLHREAGKKVLQFNTVTHEKTLTLYLPLMTSLLVTMRGIYFSTAQGSVCSFKT